MKNIHKINDNIYITSDEEIKDVRQYNGEWQLVAELRGWGALYNEFQSMKEAEKFQDDVGKFIVEAIREKIERDSKKEIK